MGYITRLKKYQHLSDAIEGKRFGAICPSSPETIQLLEDLIGEVSELFTSDYIHAGFDEVNFGSCPRCRERLTQEKSWEIFAQHAEAVREMMSANGKKMMMWGDHLTSEPALADRLPKDIVICDWQYFDVEASSVAGLLDRGFDVICCPALTNFFKVIHPRESNLQNIKDFTTVVAELRSPGIIGMMNTVWCPYRFLQGAVVHGIALAAHVFRNGGMEPERFSEEFATDYFGVDDAGAVGQAIRKLYQVVSDLLLVRNLAPLGWDEFEPLASGEVEECTRVCEEASEISSTLQENRAHVRRNMNHYDDIMMTVEIIAELARNGDDIRKLFETVTVHDLVEGIPRTPRVQELLGSLAERTRAVHARVRERWNENRFEDEPDRDGRANIHPSDASLLYRLETAAGFFASLIGDTET
jgi:hypothetical protein